MKTETEITSTLVRELKKFYAMVLSIHGHKMQSSGWPDLYISHWKFNGWIECKGAKTPVEPLQRKIMGELKKRNEKVFILRFTLPKVYSLRNHTEEVLIQDIYGTPKEAAGRLLDELSVY